MVGREAQSIEQSAEDEWFGTARGPHATASCAHAERHAPYRAEHCSAAMERYMPSGTALSPAHEHHSPELRAFPFPAIVQNQPAAWDIVTARA